MNIIFGLIFYLVVDEKMFLRYFFLYFYDVKFYLKFRILNFINVNIV